MGRKRSAGLRLRHGVWHIEKQIYGKKLCESTGTGRLEEAELILARRREEQRQAKVFGVRPRRMFREAATRYLEENMHLASIGDWALHLRQLDPFIGALTLDRVHSGTLQPFIDHRRHAGVKVKSINLALGLVRRILNLSARLWRDEHGLTWLENAPLIQLLPDSTAREPYPLDWEEQRRLFQALPDHLARMCLFKVNTGCREQEVCGLRWEWEVQVPELETSVFIIPGVRVRNREDRLVVMNRVARSVVEEARGAHPQFVFTYRGHPVQCINNNGWQRARRLVGFDASSGARLEAHVRPPSARGRRAARDAQGVTRTQERRHHDALLGAGIAGVDRGRRTGLWTKLRQNFGKDLAEESSGQRRWPLTD